MTTTGKSLARPRWWSGEEFTLSVVSSSKRILTCICIVAVTSLCLERGWLPDGFAVNGKDYRGRLPGLDAGLILRAAFVPRPIHVSGWDMAAGAAKPTSRMVAPGAVYFFDKTSVMAIWLVARACGANVPRRLVYVVDRRAVVDQATDVARGLRAFVDGELGMREALGFRDNQSLPISTLRG